MIWTEFDGRARGYLFVYVNQNGLNIFSTEIYLRCANNRIMKIREQMRFQIKNRSNIKYSVQISIQVNKIFVRIFK